MISTLRINDEVKCVFLGLAEEHREFFSSKYAIKAPNYYWSPAYRLGKWDGNIKYFTASGQTYVQLIEELVPQILKLGYKIKIVDKRKGDLIFPPPITENYFNEFRDKETGNPIVLWDYQVDIVNLLLEAGSGVAVAPTASGKTFIIAALCDSYEKLRLRTIVVVPSMDLITQTVDVYKDFQLDVGEYSGGVKDLAHMHVVSTWQTLQNNPTIIQMFQVVVVDEVHRAAAKVLAELLIKYGKNIIHRFGVTGTLPKAAADALTVRVAIGKVLYNLKAKTLVDREILSELNISILRIRTDLTREYADWNAIPENPKVTYLKFKDTYFPDFSAERDYLNRDIERTELIATQIIKMGKKRKGNVLCLVSSKQFGRDLSECIEDSVFVCGEDKAADRKDIYKLFASSDNLVIIATVHIAGTGLDIRRIFHLVFIDIGKSFIRVIQSIGRGLRKAVDKNSVTVVDICSDLKYSKRHMSERVRFYKDAQYPYKKYLVLRPEKPNVDI